jgi:pyridinium-3,5-biscarboxylic acid mononucleotide synthase
MMPSLGPSQVEVNGPDARIDLQRSGRIGIPEAIYCQGKTVDQCVEIVAEVLERGADAVIATRATAEQAEALLALGPEDTAGRTLSWRHRGPTGRCVAVVAAGTSDLPVSDEARLTLTAMGHTPILVNDVGVAGLHRLISALPEFDTADVIIALAGMEGALPTVLAGLVGQPLIAVPTSAGYGSSFEGATAMLSMMASCAPGVAVVGIDNGYGAACAAHRVLGVIDAAIDHRHQR